MNYNKSFISLLTYISIFFGYIFTKGYYSFGGIILILLSLALLLAQILNKDIKLSFKVNKTSFYQSVKLSVFMSLCLALILYGGLYQELPILITLSKIILSFAILLYLFSFLEKPKQKLFKLFYQKRYFVLFSFSLLLRLLMVISSPSPIIDVWDKLMIASQGVLEGKNPYHLTFSQIYPGVVPSGFGHLPGLFIFFSPAVLIFGDVRFVYVFSDLLFIYLLVRLVKLKKDKILYDFGLLYLYNPVSLFVLEQSWLEPFMLSALFSFFAFTILRKRKLRLFALTIFLSTKVYNCLIIPLLFKFKKINKREIILSFLLTLVIALPFFIADPKEFLYDTFLNIFRKGYNSAPINIALTFRNFLKDFFNLYYGTLTALIISSAIPLITYFWAKVNNFNKLFLSTAFLYLGFVFFNFQAFCNYFFFISSLIIFSLIAEIISNKKLKTEI